jgi:hypothetical protein
MNARMEHPEMAGDETGRQGVGDQPDVAGAPHAGAPPAGASDAAAPSEEQLRAAYEAELSRIASVDMVLQASASLLNIGAHRLGLTGGPGAQAGPPAQRDLEQVRDAIDAVRGLLPVIERSAPGELRPLRDALSQLQMAYSRAVQAAPAGQAPPAAAPPAATSPGPAPAGEPAATPPVSDSAQGGAQDEKPGPGPAESSGRLWVPGR